MRQIQQTTRNKSMNKITQEHQHITILHVHCCKADNFLLLFFILTCNCECSVSTVWTCTLTVVSWVICTHLENYWEYKWVQSITEEHLMMSEGIEWDIPTHFYIHTCTKSMSEYDLSYRNNIHVHVQVNTMILRFATRTCTCMSWQFNSISYLETPFFKNSEL